MPRPRSRRSTEIIAPGFGTQTDLERLARDLSETTGSQAADAPVITAAVVHSMMNSRGRGRRRRDGEPEEAVAAAAPTSSAWADFMQEEGMAGTTTTATTDDGAAAAKKRGDDDDNAPATEEEESKKIAAAATVDGKSQTYELDFSKHKKAKPTAGLLVQSGTLNSAIVGRGEFLQCLSLAVNGFNCHRFCLEPILIARYDSCISPRQEVAELQGALRVRSANHSQTPRESPVRLFGGTCLPHHRYYGSW
jgi:hypothetical protein